MLRLRLRLQQMRLIDDDRSGVVEFKELNKVLRVGQTVKLAKELKVGGAGTIDRWGRTASSSKAPAKASASAAGGPARKPKVKVVRKPKVQPGKKASPDMSSRPKWNTGTKIKYKDELPSRD